MRSLILKLNFALLIFMAVFPSCKKQLKDNEQPPAAKATTKTEEAYPGVQGEIIHFIHGKDSMCVKKIEDKYIWLGDIVLDKNSYEQLRNGGGSNQRTFTADGNRLWPSAIVYYTIQSGFSTDELARINNAMAEWQTNTPISFVQRTTQSNYVTFVHGSTGSGFYSNFIGMKGGQQIINLESGFIAGNAMHEIGHTIGFYHEQCRTDRGNAINVNYNNVVPHDENHIYQYRTYDEIGDLGFQIGDFDFESVMLYDSWANSDQIHPVITRLDGTTFGVQRFWLSNGDIETATYMYNPPQIWGRLEAVQTAYSSYWGDASGEYEEEDIFARFYADAACTIPANLTQPVKFRYTYATTVFSSNNNSSTSYGAAATILQPGNSSYQLDHITSISTNMDYGMYRDGSFVTSVYGEKGVGYR